MKPSPRHLTAHATRLALAALLAAPCVATAQSSYVMTTLSGSFSSDEPLKLDSQNRVLGSILLKVGSRPNYYWWLPPEPINASFMAQWAQPIFGSTVSSTQLSKTVGYLAAASPNGDKLVSVPPNYVNPIALYDRATKVFQPVPGAITYTNNVNNAGTVIGVRTGDPIPPGEPVADANNADAWRRALVWTPGQSVITLPTGSFTGADARAINNAGVIAGTVFKAPSKANMHAARWVNGVLEVLDNEPGKVSSSIDISEGGHILIVKSTPQVTPVPSEVTAGGIYYAIDLVNPIYGVVHQGNFTQIVSSIPGYTALNARQVNASGTVIGTVFSDPPPPGGIYKTPRAFMWQNGQMQDLTTLVASKGVKLPAGTVLNNVVSINDQGSLVVGFEHPSTKKQTYVRLQAKP
jgi:probable HAF family extracellular repeat protein